MAPRPLLIVCDFNGHGGTQTQVLELLAALDRDRIAPRLATLTLDSGLATRVEALEVPVTDLDLAEAFSLRTWRAVARLAGAIRREGVLLVHGFLFQGSAVAAMAARWAGIPYMTSVRNLELWKRPHELAFSRWIHAGARRVTFNSTHVRDLTCAREGVDPARTCVIDNGLPDLPAAEPLDPDPWRGAAGPRLACVASLSRKKGHSFLMRAFSGVQASHPGARLVLVGEGPLRAELESEAARLGIAGQVAFAGRRSDARAVIAAADLLVLSSLEEGMPNVLIEAMAAGVPQVATAVGGTPETVEEGGTGFLVPPGDPVMMCERIRRLLGDDGLRRRMGRRSRALFLERFGVARMARRHEELYEGVLDQGAVS